MASHSPQCSSFRWLWKMADCALLLFVFFPAMVFYWRGIWELVGVYIYPNQQPLCHIVATAIGACTFFGYYALPLLSRVLSHENKFVYILVTRMVMIVYGALSMIYWRGVWSLADYYLLPLGWIAGLIGLVTCYGSLVLLQASRTTIFPPFFVSLDISKDMLQPESRLRRKLETSSCSSILWHLSDVFLTQFIIMPLVIISWRSCFNLLDTFLYPDVSLWSDIASYVIGLVMAITFFLLEEPLAKVGVELEIAKQPRWLQLAYDDSIVFVVSMSCMILWRGAWNLTVRYFITDPLIGGWTDHLTGTVMLISLQLFSYAGACGCTMDGREPERADDVIFNTDYLRYFFRKRFERRVPESQLSDGEDISRHFLHVAGNDIFPVSSVEMKGIGEEIRGAVYYDSYELSAYKFDNPTVPWKPSADSDHELKRETATPPSCVQFEAMIETSPSVKDEDICNNCHTNKSFESMENDYTTTAEKRGEIQLDDYDFSECSKNGLTDFVADINDSLDGATGGNDSNSLSASKEVTQTLSQYAFSNEAFNADNDTTETTSNVVTSTYL